MAMSPTPDGSKDNPIDLDSDSESDESDKVVYRGRLGFRGRVQDEAEPMDIDGSELDRLPKHDFGIVDTSRDASLARQLGETEKRPEQALEATRDCVVCAEKFPVAELPSLAAYDHLPQTCATCYSTWVATQLQDSGWKEAECPEEHCKTQLTYYEIQQMTSPDVIQQYDTFITRAALGEDSEFLGLCEIEQIKLTGWCSGFPMVSSMWLRANSW
jgi:hypothetical protein